MSVQSKAIFNFLVTIFTAFHSFATYNQFTNLRRTQMETHHVLVLQYIDFNTFMNIDNVSGISIARLPWSSSFIQVNERRSHTSSAPQMHSLRAIQSVICTNQSFSQSSSVGTGWVAQRNCQSTPPKYLFTIEQFNFRLIRPTRRNDVEHFIAGTNADVDGGRNEKAQGSPKNPSRRNPWNWYLFIHRRRVTVQFFLLLRTKWRTFCYLFGQSNRNKGRESFDEYWIFIYVDEEEGGNSCEASLLTFSAQSTTEVDDELQAMN